MDENIKELSQEDLGKVAGGVIPQEYEVRNLQDIENCLELKDALLRIMKTGKNACIDHPTQHLTKEEFFISFSRAASTAHVFLENGIPQSVIEEFYNKYWDQI